LQIGIKYNCNSWLIIKIDNGKSLVRDKGKGHFLVISKEVDQTGQTCVKTCVNELIINKIQKIVKLLLIISVRN